MKRLSKPMRSETSSAGRLQFSDEKLKSSDSEPEFDRRTNRAAHRLDAAPMTLDARQAARLRPASVAVHDDADMSWPTRIGRIGRTGRWGAATCGGLGRGHAKPA